MEAKFKYEDMRTALDMVGVGDYILSFSVKSGYHHIDICEEHWQYLGFSWEVEGTTYYYVTL